MIDFFKKYRTSILILIKLLACYYILLGVFRAYVGVVDPKGFHIDFLARYNLIQGMLNALIYPVKYILELLGYKTRYTNDSVGIVNGPGVRIFFACLGIRIMFAYTALLVAFEGTRKWIFWIAGILMIYLFNIIRMFSIIYFSDGKTKIMAITHDWFNYAGYTVVIVFFLWWYIRYSKKENLSE